MTTITMIYRHSCSYLCMKWEVPHVIRILKESMSRYNIEGVHYHCVYVKIIFICLFIIILQTISCQISLSSINPRNERISQHSLSMRMQIIDQDTSTYVTQWCWNVICVKTCEDRFGKRRTKFLPGCTSNASLHWVLVLTVCFRIQDATVVFTGTSNAKV